MPNICHVCGEPFQIDPTGIANHEDATEPDGINHDADADHVPFALDDALDLRHAQTWWLGKCLKASSNRLTRTVTCPCAGAPEYFHQDEFRTCCEAAGLPEFPRPATPKESP